MKGSPMFAASLLVVALSAGVLLWFFVRQSPRFGGLARSAAPVAEALPGRTRRAGEGLVYHPPADPAPPPVLAPVTPLGLSPGTDAEPDEAEPVEQDESAFGSVVWDDGAEEEEDAAEEEAFEPAPTPEPVLRAPSPLGLTPGTAVSGDEAEDENETPAAAWHPEPEQDAFEPAPRVRTASPLLGLTPGYATDDDTGDNDAIEAVDDYVAAAWQAAEEEDEEEEENAFEAAPLALAPAPAAAPEPAPLSEDSGFDWTQTAALRLRELGTLVATGGFAAYFAEVRSPHAWDEMIEALRAIGAPEAAEIATIAGETQWPFHEQDILAPREDFGQADTQWAMLDPDLPGLLDAWLAAQASRSVAQG